MGVATWESQMVEDFLFISQVEAKHSRLKGDHCLGKLRLPMLNAKTAFVFGISTVFCYTNNCPMAMENSAHVIPSTNTALKRALRNTSQEMPESDSDHFFRHDAFIFIFFNLAGLCYAIKRTLTFI